MFCNFCGKQLEDGSRFCKFCGAKLVENNQTTNADCSGSSYKTNSGNDNIHNENNFQEHHNNSIILGMTATDILISVLLIIVGLRWCDVFFSNWSNTKDAFYWLDSEWLGLCAYSVPFLIMIALCVSGILEIKLKKYHISIGAMIMVVGIIMKIGSMIFDDFSFETMEIITYRVFLVYGQISFFTIIVGAIIAGLCYAKTK